MEYGYWLAHARARSFSRRMESANGGTSAAPTLRAGRSIISKDSPADPNRLYASQSSGWFGQIIQRSDDGGKTWYQPGTPLGEPTTTPDGMPKGESNKFVYDTSAETGKPLTTHQWYDGTPQPVGVQARLASRTVADRSRHCLRRR